MEEGQGGKKESPEPTTTTVIKVTNRVEGGSLGVEKVVVPEKQRPETQRYIEKKLWDKGLHRFERHPVDGQGLAQGPPKSGRGGKYTWEGPVDPADSELNPAPPAIDEFDPNYVAPAADAEGGEDETIVGEVEVAKLAEAKEGVSRIEVRPPLQL